MNKRLAIWLLCLVSGLLMIIPGASASSWGLTGDLYLAVSSVTTWNDYTALDQQAGDAAILHSRYHNALMALSGDDRQLSVYTKALYQPDDGRDQQAKLTKAGDGFTLSYGDTEWYTFQQIDGVYTLVEAVIGDFSVTLTNHNDLYGYLGQSLTDNADSAEMRISFPLSRFNIKLFPRSAAEIRRMNYLRAALIIGQYCLGFATYPDDMPDYKHRSNIGTGTEPVYAAPYGEGAWRAANGKAAVGLSGELWTLGGGRYARRHRLDLYPLQRKPAYAAHRLYPLLRAEKGYANRSHQNQLE